MPINKQPLVVSAFSGSPFVSTYGAPIISTRNPTVNDKFPLGQVWVNKTLNTSYLETSIVSNQAQWQEITNAGGGGAGVFTSLTVSPGPTSITGSFTLIAGTNDVHLADDAADHDITIGSTTGASAMVLQGGSGGVSILPADNGDIFIGTATQDNTSIIVLGASTLGQDVSIASGDNMQAQAVEISNGDSGANTVLNIMSGTGTFGAGVIAFGSNPRVTTIGIANVAPAAARTITVAGGNQAQNDTVSILNGSASAGNQVMNVLSGTIGAAATGTINLINGANAGAQAINIASGANAAASTVSIANGASSAGANVVNLMSGILGGTSTGVVNIANGAAAVNLDVNILSGVGSAGAATLALGNNTRVTTIGLGDIAPAAARTIRIAGGDAAQNDTVAILSGNPSANAQTFSVLSGTPTGGTQVLNLGAQTTNPIAINMGSGTGLATVQIANGAAANLVTLGSTTGAAKTTINSGSLSMDLTMAAPAVGAGGILVTQGGVPFRILCGAGAPNNNLAIQIGDLYIRSDAGGATERIYVATGAGAWTNVTCAA